MNSIVVPHVFDYVRSGAVAPTVQVAGGNCTLIEFAFLLHRQYVHAYKKWLQLSSIVVLNPGSGRTKIIKTSRDFLPFLMSLSLSLIRLIC